MLKACYYRERRRRTNDLQRHHKKVRLLFSVFFNKGTPTCHMHGGVPLFLTPEAIFFEAT